MEENEQGLTKEEKFMFSILGIVLSIAIGVLIINSFSEKERTLQEETPIAEENKDEEKVEPNNNTPEILIEDDEEEIPEVEEIVVEKPAKKPEHVIVHPTKPVKPNKPTPEVDNKPSIPEENGEGDVIPDEVLNWSIKDTIVTEIYEGEKLVLDNTIYLEDKTLDEAELKLIRLNNGIEEVIDTTNNEAVLEVGNYKYVYTYANSTKELNLLVKKVFDTTNTHILNIKKDTTNIENLDTYNKLNTLLTNTTINTNNGLRIDVKEDLNNYNLLPIVLKIPGLNNETVLETSDPYITISRENEYSEPLELDEVIMLIDLDNFKTNKVKLVINNITYEFNLTLVKFTEVEFTPETEENDKQESDKEEDKEQIPEKEVEKENNSLKPNLENEDELDPENNKPLDDSVILDSTNNVKQEDTNFLSQ